MIIRSFKGGTETKYEVEVVLQAKDGFHFKATNFPPPEMGRRFVTEDNTELEISEQAMKVENGRAIYHFLATPL